MTTFGPILKARNSSRVPNGTDVEGLTARAKAAVVADPKKSNVAIAKQIGCSEMTVGRSTVKNKPKAHCAPTAAAQRMREYRARQAIGATRIAIDLDGDDKDWLRSQGVLREWDEEDERALAQALKLALQKQRRKVTA